MKGSPRFKCANHWQPTEDVELRLLTDSDWANKARSHKCLAVRRIYSSTWVPTSTCVGAQLWLRGGLQCHVRFEQDCWSVERLAGDEERVLPRSDGARGRCLHVQVNSFSPWIRRDSASRYEAVVGSGVCHVGADSRDEFQPRGASRRHTGVVLKRQGHAEARQDDGLRGWLAFHLPQVSLLVLSPSCVWLLKTSSV